MWIELTGEKVAKALDDDLGPRWTGKTEDLHSNIYMLLFHNNTLHIWIHSVGNRTRYSIFQMRLHIQHNILHLWLQKSEKINNLAKHSFKFWNMISSFCKLKYNFINCGWAVFLNRSHLTNYMLIGIHKFWEWTIFEDLSKKNFSAVYIAKPAIRNIAFTYPSYSYIINLENVHLGAVPPGNLTKLCR